MWGARLLFVPLMSWEPLFCDLSSGVLIGSVRHGDSPLDFLTDFILFCELSFEILVESGRQFDSISDLLLGLFRGFSFGAEP